MWYRLSELIQRVENHHEGAWSDGWDAGGLGEGIERNLNGSVYPRSGRSAQLADSSHATIKRLADSRIWPSSTPCRMRLDRNGPSRMAEIIGLSSSTT